LEKVSLSNGGPKIERLIPELGFYELALKKKRFPSTKARFCTQFLKIFPSIEWVNNRIAEGHTVLTHSGVRAGESLKRSKLPERDLNGNLLIPEYRPLLRWSLKDVIQIHNEHGLQLNKLYSYGARRVGCFPCIMSNKAEVRSISLNFPERIEMIRKAEQEFLKRFGRYSSFFQRKKTPLRFRTVPYTDKNGQTVLVCSIDDVVKWSLTGAKARGRYDEEKLFDNTSQNISCDSGFCE